MIDIHSMHTTSDGQPLADIVLGDLNGLTLKSSAALTEELPLPGLAGWNNPYAGGHITRQYGRANSPRQSVQIEVNRSLYMTAGLAVKPAGLARLQHLIADIASYMDQLLPTAKTIQGIIRMAQT